MSTTTPSSPNVDIWQQVRREVELRIKAEPSLTSFFHSTLLEHRTLSGALSHILAFKLDSAAMPAISMVRLFQEALHNNRHLQEQTFADLEAVRARDPACRHYSTPLLFYKGFQALQAWRLCHWFWQQQRHSLALFLQGRISEIFGVDIHPAASIGQGVMLDHAAGIVIGETAVVEDDVSIYQGVTLGWNGRDRGDRHPKIGRGVLLAVGVQVLGNIRVGEKARLAGGSVVIEPVRDGMTVAGVPAREVAGPHDTFWWQQLSPSGDERGKKTGTKRSATVK